MRKAKTILRPMFRSSMLARTLLGVLCAVLLLTQLRPASHLHLCLERSGLEPTITVHAADSGVEHVRDGTARLHTDVNLTLASDAVAQKFISDFDLTPALLGTIVLRIATPLVTIAPALAAEMIRVPRSRYRFLPPLRAPPR